MIVFSILFVIRTIAGMDHDSPYIDSSDNEISEPESTTESRLKLNVVRYLNSPFAYTTNTCRNRTSNQYYLYAHPFHQSSPSSYNRNCIKSLKMRTQFSAGVGRTAERLKASPHQSPGSRTKACSSHSRMFSDTFVTSPRA